MSVASQSLMDNVTYEDLYRRWEQGNWSAYDIDFSEDREGWEALSDIQRRSAMWIYSMFFYGEDRVADTLAPYITAAPTEEQAYFLATQQVDEVRHSVFFHRFFKEVIGVGGDSIQQTLSSTLPQLNWGYRGIFDRLDLMAEELRKDRSLPKYAQAITLYHLIVEGSLAQPGQHFIEDFFASEEHDARLQLRHGQRLPRRAAPHRLRRQGALRAARRGHPGSEECKAAVVELLRETLPYGPAVFYPPNMDRDYTECYGFSLEDIFAFGLKLIRQRWRTIGYPTEEMPPGVFPFDPEMSEEEVAERQVKLMMAGVLGPPDGPSPRSSPELQRLYFDVVKRVADPAAANGSPLVYQWRFSDADPWHLVDRQRLDPGRAGRGARPDADPRGELGRLRRRRQARRQPAEDDAAAPHPPPRLAPRAGADAQGLRLGDRRAPVRPGPLGLELGGEREQGRLVAGAADDLDRERHAVGGEAGGHRHRRVAEVVPGDAVGIEAAHPEHRAQRALALPAPHRQRRAAHHRRHQHVVGVEDRVDAGGVGRSAAQRPLEEPVGDQAAEPAEAAGAPFEPLGMRAPRRSLRRCRAGSGA